MNINMDENLLEFTKYLVRLNTLQCGESSDITVDSIFTDYASDIRSQLKVVYALEAVNHEVPKDKVKELASVLIERLKTINLIL